MEYVQINEALTDAIQVTTHGNVAWSDTHFCPASKLTTEEAEQFRVVPLYATEPPTINSSTQTVIRDGCEFVGGRWQYKWRIDSLSPEQVTAKFQAAKAAALLEIDRQNQVMYDQTIVNTSIKDEYNAAYQAATAWLANQALPAPTRVVSLAAKFGVSNLMAATIVKTKTEEGNAKLDARGAARLNGKTAIEAATTVDQVNTALAAGIAAMRAVSFTI